MGLFTTIKEKIGQSGASAGVVTEEMVRSALSVVQDPDLHNDIVSLGFVRNIVIKGSAISLEVNLTTPACPVKEQLKQQCEDILRKLPGIEQVEVKMTATTRGAKLSEAAAVTPMLANVRNIIAVASGKGGVGKSTTAVNLAYALQRLGGRVGLLDADIYGPSIPRMVKISATATQDGNIVVPPDADGIKVISMGMFTSGNQAAILRGPMAGQIIKQFLTQVQWGDLDYLIIDYPPGTGDIQLTISQTAPVTGAVIVTTPQEISLIDVRKAIGMFKTLKVPVLGVIETMSWFVCDSCDKRHHIFRTGGGEKLANENGVAFLGGIPIEASVAVGGDEGVPAVLGASDSAVAKAYVTAAQQTAAQLSILNAQQQSALQQFALDWKN